MISDFSNSRRNERVIDNLKVWQNQIHSKTIFVNKGKKTKHSLQIIASLALNGPSTTREMAKFVIGSSPKYLHSKINNREISIIEQTFARLIEGRFEKRTGKKKLDTFYPGLEEFGYVRTMEQKINSKNKTISKYSLGFRGFVFALGFNFRGKDMENFLRNARKNHLFFAYIENIAKCTSYDFARKMLLDPLSEMIKNNIISIDKDLSFYFSNFAEEIGRKLEKLIKDMRELDDEYTEIRFQYMNVILKWTYYDDRPTLDWSNSMLDIFYLDFDERWFFRNHAQMGMEKNLLYKIMQRIHLIFFGYEGGSIPRRTQNIPYSSIWKENARYHPEYKNPRDHDKKRKIMVRYDANHIRA